MYALFPIWGDSFLQGADFAPLHPPSSVRRRAMLLKMWKAGLSDDVEQKCGKMFVSSSHFFVE